MNSIIEGENNYYSYFWITLIITIGISFIIFIFEKIHDYFTLRKQYIQIRNGPQKNHSIKNSIIDFISNSPIPLIYQIFYTILALFACGVFIYMTIEVTDFNQAIFETNWIIIVHFILSLFSLFDYTILYVFSKTRSSYVIHPINFLKLAVSIPGIIGIITHFFFYGFQWIWFMRLWLFSAFIVKNKYFFTGRLFGAIMVLFFTVATLMVAASSLIFVFENPASFPNSQVENLFDGFYLTTVTIFTVGYGDIVPKTILGKLIIMSTIILGFILVPNQLLKLGALIYQENKRKSYSGDNHAILSTGPDSIKDFVNEFFYKDKNTSLNLNLVVLVKSENDTPKLSKFAKRSKIIVGSLLNSRDRKRMRSSIAQVFFLLSDKFSKGIQQDAATILEAIAIHNEQTELATIHGGVKAELYVQILSSKSKQTLLKIPTVKGVICIEEIKMTLLAQSCLVPGFSTLIGNLMRSSFINKKEDLDGWFQEYKYGLSQEIYSKDLSKFSNKSFSSLSKDLYLKYNVLLLGLITKEEQESPNSHIFINPGKDYSIKVGDLGFILAINHATAVSAVSSLSSSEVSSVNSKGEDIDENLLSPHSRTVVRNISLFVHHKAKSIDEYEFDTSHEEKILKEIELRKVYSVPNHFNHIVATGPLNGIEHFLDSLKHAEKQVILLVDEYPSIEIWKMIIKFSFVHVIKGSSLDLDALHRCNLKKADCMVIFGTDVITPSLVEMDAKNILVYRTVSDIVPPILDLVHPQNIAYVGSDHSTNSKLTSSPYYASGSVFSSSLLDTLVCLTYYNKYIIEVIESLILGGVYLLSIRTNLPKFAGKTYGFLLEALSTQGIIPLGIRRRREKPRQYLCYIATNPPANTVLLEDDHIYCLSSHKPTETEESSKKEVKVEGKEGEIELKVVDQNGKESME